MAKSSFDRRDFLKLTVGGSVSILGGCASLDRYFMGDDRDLSKEVVILGAGAAGLATAFELRKNKIPFRLFEASSRVGGRVHSVTVFPEEGPLAEMGAEFFDNSHTEVFRLAKELNIQVRELEKASGLETQIFYFDKKLSRSQDMILRMKTLQQPMNELLDMDRKELDVISIQALLDRWTGRVDPLIINLIRTQVVARFGAEVDQLSALHFVDTIEDSGSSLLTGRTQFRMNGGLSKLMQSLAERVAGVIPGRVLKFNHPLVEIFEKDNGFQLVFEVEGKRVTYGAKTIVCCLPFSKLRQVKGVENLNFSADKKELIRNLPYASHTKGSLLFSTPFWRQKRGSIPANLGNLTGHFSSQKFWDSGRSQDGAQGLLTFQCGGHIGKAALGQALTQAVDDLNLIYGKIPEVNVSQSPLVNWSQRKWAEGSMAYATPGLYNTWQRAMTESEYSGRFLFAGEHTSFSYTGTLQGALESGVRAASTLKKLFV